MTDAQIEQIIQAKGLTAPRITPADIEANIAAEIYSTGLDCAAEAAGDARGVFNRIKPDVDLTVVNDSLRLLTFCVLVLRNGHLVSGEAYCADPAKFNAETGRIEARKVAIDKLWPMVVYAERERLAAQNPAACQGTNCGATDGVSHSAECITEAAKDQGWDTKVAWTAIDQSTPSLSTQTLPPAGFWLVTVDTDDGREVHTLLHEGNGKWLHEGEYTFQHGYYFRPVAWAPRPEACSGPVPAED